MNRKLLDAFIERKAVIWALLNREFAVRLDDSYFSYVWIFLQPMLHLAGLFAILYSLGRDTREMPILLFLLTGIVPFIYMSSTAMRCMTCINANENLFAYKQVKIFDAIIARILLEMIITLISSITCVLILWYFEQLIIPRHSLRIIFACVNLLISSIGIGFLLSIFSYYYIDLSKFIGFVIRVLYFTSGVFFSIDRFPRYMQYYLSFNPLLQIVECIRSSFSDRGLSSYISYEYIIIFSALCLFLGVALYFISRKHILTKSRAR